MLIYRILSGKCHTTGTDDNHNEKVEVAQVHDEVAEAAHTETIKVKRQRNQAPITTPSTSSGH